MAVFVGLESRKASVSHNEPLNASSSRYYFAGGVTPGKMFMAQTKQDITTMLDGKQQDKTKSETQLQV